MTDDDVCRLAQALARNCGYAVFPCSETKAPAIPGPGGYKHASKDPDQIERLWREQPGPLIGIAPARFLIFSCSTWTLSMTLPAHGGCSMARDCRRHDNIDPAPVACISISPTRPASVLAADAAICVASMSEATVDTSSVGSPPASPASITPHQHHGLRGLSPPPPERSKVSARISTKNVDSAIAGILRTVASAPQGERNNTLNWAAHTMSKRIDAGQIGRGEAEALLAAAADAAGIPKIEASRSIASGLKGAVAA